MDEELKKKEQVILLMDCYRELLTDKQKQYLSLYYEEDLSLSEIAEDLSVSKNAVFDNIKRSVMSLEKYESKLHILENHRKRLNLINKIEEEKNKKHEDIDEYLEMLNNILGGIFGFLIFIIYTPSEIKKVNSTSDSY